SSKNKIIARCGQTKEKLKDPSKGKQRSYKNFPSETSGKTDCPWRCYRKLIKEDTSFQCRSANTWALNERESSIEDHYGMVRSYAIALLESNVGSNVKVGVTVNPDDKTYIGSVPVTFTKDFKSLIWELNLEVETSFEVRRGSDAFKLIKTVEDYVPKCFREDMYIKAYGQYMKPMDGVTFSPDCSHTTTFDVFPGDILTLSPATCRWGISAGEASSGILSPATIPSD
ncbi:hypothetical protein Tco_1001209, partial [Tanacetum coccineum]